MCEAISPMMALAMAGSVGGQLLSANAQEDAAARQQRAINASLEQQDQYSQKAEAKALENATQYDATDRLKNFEETRQSAGDSLAQQLAVSREETPQIAQPAGRLSKAFLTGDATAKANQLEQSIENARLMGNMRGAGDMLTNEGYQNADYASQLGLIGRNANGSANAAQVGINASGKVDSGSSLLGGLASGLGTAYLGSQLGKGMLGAGMSQSAAPVVNGSWKMV